MKRREFIGMAAAGAAGFVRPATARSELVVSPLAHPRLLEILRDERVVRELGARYRELVPDENDARSLAEAIGGTGGAARSQLDDRVQRDFADGRTVTLNGWVLSVTEARQCALRSLLPA
jgi:hypothetical protein